MTFIHREPFSNVVLSFAFPHTQRDVSNRADGEQPNNRAEKDGGKRPRIQLAEDDDDETSQQASKPRRLSARLLAKRKLEEKEQIKEEKAQKRGRAPSDNAKNQPAAKRSRSKSTAKQIDQLAKSRLVTKITGEDKYLVHPDFRLQRASFDGKNHTLGVAKHDRDDIDNVLTNAPYATDMFQHHFAAEVSLPLFYFQLQPFKRNAHINLTITCSQTTADKNQTRAIHG